MEKVAILLARLSATAGAQMVLNATSERHISQE